MHTLVLIVNRLRPDHLGCYGNEWLPTPGFDRLTAESVVFDFHFADDATPKGARRSWSTGRHPIRQPMPPDSKVLFPLLKQHGVESTIIGDRTAEDIVPSVVAWSETMPQLRETMPQLRSSNQKTSANRLLWIELDSLEPPWNPAEYDAGALEGLETKEMEPLFDPFTPDPNCELNAVDIERLSATYAGMVGGVDVRLEQLLDALGEQWDDLLVVLTSDCGFPLGEHQVVGDRRITLNEERLHVPLMIRLPRQAEAGRRVLSLTQHVDLMPTLLEAFEIPIPEGIDGKSLLPPATGKTPSIRDRIVSATPSGPEQRVSMRTQDWRLTTSAGAKRRDEQPPELFVKPEDRWEVNDVFGQNEEVAAMLCEALRQEVLDC